MDQLISGAVKQYIDFVKEESDETLHDALLTGTSDRISSVNDEKFITTESTINETDRKDQEFLL